MQSTRPCHFACASAVVIVPAMFFISALAGCGADANVASVNGVVRVDGKPLTTGTVRFVPPAGRAAAGKIQSDGTFTLGTFGDSDGALLGRHQVAVIAFEVGPVQRTEGGRPPPAPTKPLVPQRYMAPGTSGLTFEVKPGRNYAELDLSIK